MHARIVRIGLTLVLLGSLAALRAASAQALLNQDLGARSRGITSLHEGEIVNSAIEHPVLVEQRLGRSPRGGPPASEQDESQADANNLHAWHSPGERGAGRSRCNGCTTIHRPSAHWQPLWPSASARS